MADCVDCSCKQLNVDDKDICNQLQELNDSRIKGASLVLKDTQLCDYPKVFPKALYSIWCVMKNIVALMCKLLTMYQAIKDKLNELIDQVNAICKALQCVIAQLKSQAEEQIKEAMSKVVFSMSSSGTVVPGQTSTVVKTNSSTGEFTVVWDENDGSLVGKGELKGNLVVSYTLNEDDGSINSHFQAIKLNSISYTAVKSGSSSARFTVFDSSNNQVYTKEYNPYSSWSEVLNKTLDFKVNKRLAPNGGSTGDIFILKTLDTWLANPTEGFINAKLTNNNEPIKPVNCAIDCKEIAKLN